MQQDTTYPSSLPGFFPPIHHCRCLMEPFDLPTLDGLHLVQGLCDGVQLGVDALAGFPSLKTLKHTGMLGYHGVNVFKAESRNKSMVIHIESPFEGQSAEQVAKSMVGKKAFFGWPFLQEGLVVAVSDSQSKYSTHSPRDTGALVTTNRHSFDAAALWRRQADKLQQLYSKRFGVIIGDVDLLIHARPLKGTALILCWI